MLLKGYENTLIVDGLNLAFRYKFQKVEVFAENYISLIQSLAMSYKADKIILLGDGRSEYRKEIYPDYKGNRKYDDEEFPKFLAEFKRACNICDFCVLRFNTCEADDIASYIVKKYSDLLKHIWLVSSDKDWDLLVSPDTSRFSFLTRKETTLANWGSHYDIDIDQLISLKVLQGDKSDNIPGVSGVGEKRAGNLLREYGTAFDIYDALPINSTYKHIKELNDFGDNILRNYRLMDLVSYAEEAIGEENIKAIDIAMEKNYGI